MQILLARHGNTFGPGDPVVWVGKRNDLPLVEKGRAQARALAAALRRDGNLPDELRCGPLLRTRSFAAIVAEELGLPPARVDARLDELDYGRWSGLSTDEIRARYGARELDAWRARSEWPAEGTWPGERARVENEVRALAAELQSEARDAPGSRRVLLVSSNGRLRYFLGLVPGAFAQRVARGDFAVATGRVCRIDLARDVAAGAALRYWNVDPTKRAVL